MVSGGPPQRAISWQEREYYNSRDADSEKMSGHYLELGVPRADTSGKQTERGRCLMLTSASTRQLGQQWR